jgi:hypothetical protein
MSKPDELIEQTARRLAEVEALQQTLNSVQEELRAYQELLSQKLAILREQDVVALPVTDDDWDDLPEPPATLPEPPKPASKTIPAAAAPAKGLPVPPAKPARGISVPAKPAARVDAAPPPVPAKPGKLEAAPPPVPAKPAAPPVSPKPSRLEATIRAVRAEPTPAPAPPTPPSKDTIHSRAPVLQPQPEPEAELEFEEEEEESRGERRASPRRGGNPVSVQITNSDGESYQGWVVDRSSGGVRLLVDQSFNTGTILNVKPTKAHPSLNWIKVRVKSCRPERNSFKVGCEFVNKMSWAELQALG